MKMALVSVAGMCGLAYASCNETMVQSCYEFPKVRENLIINRQGDQKPIRSDENFNYTYVYRTKEKYRVVNAADEGKPAVDSYEKVENKERNFRGDSVESVRRLAENFIASHEAQTCKP